MICQSVKQGLEALANITANASIPSIWLSRPR